MSAKNKVLLALGVVAALAYCALVWRWREATALRLVTKPIPILCLIAWALDSPARAYGRGLALGLGFAAAGDVFLVLRGERWFLLGLVANLIAHVVYTVVFVRDHRALRPVLLLPFAAWVGGMFVFLRPGLGGLQLPVAAYCAAIAVMMWRAGARVWAPERERRAALAGAIGAVSFGVSDTLLALDRFHAPIAGIALPIILTYWLGQLGIAASAALRRA